MSQEHQGKKNIFHSQKSAIYIPPENSHYLPHQTLAEHVITFFYEHVSNLQPHCCKVRRKEKVLKNTSSNWLRLMSPPHPVAIINVVR